MWVINANQKMQARKAWFMLRNSSWKLQSISQSPVLEAVVTCLTDFTVKVPRMKVRMAYSTTPSSSFFSSSSSSFCLS